MTERCPECGCRFAENGPCEVYAEVRASEEHGLRIDFEFECYCGTQIRIEDVGADDGSLGRGSTGFLSRFDGKGYRA